MIFHNIFRFHHRAISSRVALGTISAALAALFLSSYSIFAKMLLETFRPETVAALGQIISAVILLLCFGLITEIKKFSRLKKIEKNWLVIMAVLAAIIAPYLILKGLNETSATNSILLTRFHTVTAMLCASFWLREKITLNQIIGTGLMFLGILAIITKFFSEAIQFGAGDSLILGGAIVLGFATAIAKKHLSHVAPELIVLIRSLTGGLFFFLLFPALADFQGSNGNIVLPTETLKTLFLFALFAILLSRLLWYNALEMIETRRAMTITMAQPLFGVILAVIMLGETIHTYHWYGGGLIVLGLICTLLDKTKHEDLIAKTKPFS